MYSLTHYNSVEDNGLHRRFDLDLPFIVQDKVFLCNRRENRLKRPHGDVISIMTNVQGCQNVSRSVCEPGHIDLFGLFYF